MTCRVLRIGYRQEQLIALLATRLSVTAPRASELIAMPVDGTAVALNRLVANGVLTKAHDRQHAVFFLTMTQRDWAFPRVAA